MRSRIGDAIASPSETITIIIDRVPPVFPSINGLTAGDYTSLQVFMVTGKTGTLCEYSVYVIIRYAVPETPGIH